MDMRRTTQLLMILASLSAGVLPCARAEHSTAVAAAGVSAPPAPDEVVINCRRLISALAPPPPLKYEFVYKPEYAKYYDETGVRFKIEVEEAGEIYHADTWRPSRSNETFLYLVDSYGNTWITPQYLLLPYGVERYMATHRALMARMERHYREQGLPMPEILASGQVVYRYGQPTRFDNRSGGFLGATDSLNYALTVFRLMDFPLPPKLDVYDFSLEKTKDPEEIHAKRVQILAEAHSPAFQAQRDRWKNLMNKLYQRFPNPHRVGFIDNMAFLDAATPFVLADSRTLMEPFVESGQALPFMNESLDMVTFQYFRTPERTENTIRFIEYMLSLLPPAPNP